MFESRVEAASKRFVHEIHVHTVAGLHNIYTIGLGIRNFTSFYFLDRPSRYTLLADEIMMRVGCKRAMVYLDFVKDVSPVAIALREKGVKSCSYHGKSMSGHDKLIALEN